MLILVGNTLTVTGCLGLVLGAIGVVDPEHFAIGISSGVRIVGSVAITGCLLSAMGYGILDLQER
jgi:hydroxyethylthiazole kinase-like sugar kinase family protein